MRTPRTWPVRERGGRRGVRGGDPEGAERPERRAAERAQDALPDRDQPWGCDRGRGKIYGDGVNVAARLDGLADGGGICVSRSVHDQVKNKLDVGYQALGQHSVEEHRGTRSGVSRRAGAGSRRGKRSSRFWSRMKQWQKVALTLGVALLQVVGDLVVKKYIDPARFAAGFATFRTEKAALPLPDKPSIAVLPFENMTGDPKQEYFTDGFTEADHHVPVEDLGAVRHLPELDVHLQREAGEGPAGGRGARGPVRAGGERPEIQRPDADQRPVDRCDLGPTPMGRILRSRPEGHLLAAGRDHPEDPDGDARESDHRRAGPGVGERHEESRSLPETHAGAGDHLPGESGEQCPGPADDRGNDRPGSEVCS